MDTYIVTDLMVRRTPSPPAPPQTWTVSLSSLLPSYSIPPLPLSLPRPRAVSWASVKVEDRGGDGIAFWRDVASRERCEPRALSNLGKPFMEIKCNGRINPKTQPISQEADMEQIIKSSQGLSTEHVRCLTFQLLTGLKHLHARGIVHRDLKPANLVVDSQCRLKICDFGLSRHISSNASVSEAEDERFTDYVVTRWYRAPELLLGCKRYSTAVDMWAAGCILGEIIVRKPIFPGTNTSDMIIKLCSRLSPPSSVQLDMLTKDAAAKTFVRSLPVRPPTAWAETHPSAVLDPAALSLLDALLVWTPAGRASVEAALSHPFVVSLQEQGEASAHRANCDH